MSDPVLTGQDNPYALLVRTPHLGADIRLHVYEPDGETTRGIISDALEVEVYDRAGQTPTLTVKATNHAPSTRYLLQGPCIVAVEMMVQYKTDLDHFVYDELRNMRFVVLDVSHDRSLAGDPTDTYTIKGVGMFNLFEGSRVLLAPAGTPPEGEEQTSATAEKRVFTNTTPGDIVWTLFNEAKARGELLPVQLGFNRDTDTFGNPWPTVSREYSPSTSLRTVISNMLESGLAEFWMNKGTLYMSLIGEWDRVFFQPVSPRPYIRDLTPDSAPETVAYNELISRVLLIGDEGYTREGSVEPDPVLMPFGGRTLVIEAGGVSTDEDADRMINQALIEGGGATRTYTRDWTYAGDQTPMGYLPFRDFNPGDWVLCDIDGESRATMQVRDMSLKRAEGVLKASVTLGSLRDDLLTRLARQSQALSDGAAVASTGRPKPVAGGGEYDAHPGKKQGLKITDKAGGLKAYSGTGDETMAVDKDTGQVRLNGMVETESLNFAHSTSDVESGRNYMPISTMSPNSMDHDYPDKINGVMSTSRSANGYAASGAYHYEGEPHAVLGVLYPGEDQKGETAGVGAIATADGTAVTVSGNTVYLEGDAHYISGNAKFHDDVEIDGTVKMRQADIPIVASDGYTNELTYPIYLTASGRIVRGRKLAKQPI